MTPEQRITQLEAHVAQLTEKLNNLGSFNTITFPVEKAFRNRLGIDGLQAKITDVTDEFPANPLGKQVSEAGSSTYYVTDVPDVVLSVRVGNVNVAIPAFDY